MPRGELSRLLDDVCGRFGSLVHMRVVKPSRPAVAADALVDPDVHAHGFRQAREARRLELVEDYLELIADLIGDCGEARQVDIAARLGVAQPTVAKMLRRLSADGLVSRRPYRGIFLTETGRALAEHTRARHHVVETFLCALGVSPEIARRDAEGIEHHVSDETLDAFRAFAGAAALPDHPGTKLMPGDAARRGKRGGHPS